MRIIYCSVTKRNSINLLKIIGYYQHAILGLDFVGKTPNKYKIFIILKSCTNNTRIVGTRKTEEFWDAGNFFGYIFASFFGLIALVT